MDRAFQQIGVVTELMIVEITVTKTIVVRLLLAFYLKESLTFIATTLNKNTSNIRFHFLLQKVSEQRPQQRLQLQTTRTRRRPPPRLH